MIGGETLQYIKTYFSPRVFSMAVLGVPYGMMYFLAVPTLQVWLKEVGVSNTSIGFFAWVSLPYVLKFLWAPLVGYIKIPILGHWFGHRRSWLVTAHLALMILLLLISWSNPAHQLGYIIFLTFLLTFFSGIQDIVVDAYRIEILSKEQAGPGIGMLISGYRFGSVTATAGALYLAESYGWAVSYMWMAALVVMGVVAALMNPEPNTPVALEQNFLKGYVWPPLQDFLTRNGWAWIAVFVVVFRLGDAMIHNMVNIFYLEVGFSKSEIAHVTKIFGMAPTLVGGLLGGALVVRFSLFQALYFCGLFHALSHLTFVWQATLGYQINFLYIVIFLENITSGLTTAVFLVYLSRQANLMYTATQYALLTSLWSLATIIAGCSGWVVDALDHKWPIFFLIAFFVSLPGVFMIKRISRYGLANHGAGASP